MRPHSLEERRIVVIRASVKGELFPDDKCSPMAVVATDALRDTDAALWPVVVQAAMTMLEDARGGLHLQAGEAPCAPVWAERSVIRPQGRSMGCLI